MPNLEFIPRPAPPPSPWLLANIRAGLRATLRRDEHRLSRIACPPGQTSPTALMLKRRIADTRATLAEMEAE
jgi:hypothetical protein